MNPEAKNKPREICPVKKGYGMGVTAVTPLGGASLHSALRMLSKVLPPSLDDSKAKQQAWQSKFASLKKIIKTDKVPFYVSAVSQSATVDLDERPEMANEPPQVKLSGWCADAENSKGVEPGCCIDILHETALKATNCADIHAACALIEIAANAGALSVVVCANQYRPGKERIKSMLYGFPIVDTRALLRSVQVPVDPASLRLDPSGNYFVFQTDFKVLFPSSSSGVEARAVLTVKGSEDPDHEEGGAGEAAGAADGGACEEGDEGECAAEAHVVAAEACEIDDEGELLSPHLHISKDVLVGIRGEEEIKCTDFMLVGNNVRLSKGYYARFVHPSMSEKSEGGGVVLWGGYVSMSKAQITMAGKLFFMFFSVCARHV